MLSLQKMSDPVLSSRARGFAVHSLVGGEHQIDVEHPPTVVRYKEGECLTACHATSTYHAASTYHVNLLNISISIRYLAKIHAS